MTSMPTTQDTDFLINLISNLRDCGSYKTFSSNLKRCSVAIVLRFNFLETIPLRDLGSNVDIPSPNNLINHLNLIQSMGYQQVRTLRKRDWRIVNLLEDAKKYQCQLELLVMRRKTNKRDRWSGHICLPGGKKDDLTDISDYDTATREFLEECGMNLKNSKHFVHLGELDDRYVKSRFGFKNLMVLSPQVFLQVHRHELPIQPQINEVDTLAWLPVNYFLSYLKFPMEFNNNQDKFNLIADNNNNNNNNNISSTEHMIIDISSFLIPTNKFLYFPQKLLRYLIGNMYFKCLPLPSPLNESKLWGLTLTIISDLLDMGNNPKLITHILPLDHPLPKFDFKDLNYLLNLFCPIHSLRKPVTKRVSFVWETYFQTFHFLLIYLLLSRTTMIYFLFKYGLPWIKKIKLNLLKK